MKGREGREGGEGQGKEGQERAAHSGYSGMNGNINMDIQLTLNLLTTTIVAPPSNASKWQMGFNSAFKGLKGCDDVNRIHLAEN